MDPRLLQYYNRELQFVREMGGEFAAEFPKIAGRLALDGFECADPYVERLLEGFAFLAARVQLKLDAQFPKFTQHLLEMVFPHYLAPTPSLAVVQFQPDLAQGALAAGFPLRRGTALRSQLGKGDQTPCDYRTAQEVTLWPLEVAEAEYVPHGRSVAAGGVPGPPAAAALRLRLRATAGLTFDRLALEDLTLFLRGTGDLPYCLYEHLTAHTSGIAAGPPSPQAPKVFLPGSRVAPVGFRDEEALLPFGPRSFQGYRLVQEYFAFPQRFLFVGVGGLGPAVRRCTAAELELTFAFSRAEPLLENAVDASHFALFCAPAVNLFPKRADRIHLSDRTAEFHVVPDRTRPLDFEVHSVTDVVGYGAGGDRQQEFLPFYALSDATRAEDHRAYYTVHRSPRVLSARQRTQGPRTSYVGSEVYLSLVDAQEAPYSSDLRQVAVGTVCTNRDLPLQMPLGQGRTDFTLEAGAPVEAVRCVAGPTRPRPSHADGEAAWRLISHLSLNYLSLLDADEAQGAAAMREILTLYGAGADAPLRKQVEGLRSVRSQPVNRRLPGSGPPAFGRGLQVTFTLEEASFGGRAGFLLASVLDRFVARYVSLNSFTETVLRTVERGEVMRWPPRAGTRPLL